MSRRMRMQLTSYMNKNLLLLAIPITLAACSRPAPGTRAHDDSAAGHREEAAKHQAEADQTLAYANSKAYYQSVHQDHKRLAKAHLRAAEQVEAEYAAACEDRAPESVKAWPEVKSTDEIPGGIVLHLSPDLGSEEEVIAHFECHRAALALEGFDRFPDDPLALESLDVIVHDEPGGTAVMFGVDGDAQVGELRWRVDACARGGR
jgi:hypothetical protein